MLINVVEEVRVVVDTLVSSRIRQAEGVDGLKHGFQALSENNKENLDKPLLYRLRPTQDSTVAEYANSLKQWTGKATARIVFDSTVDEFMSECLLRANQTSRLSRQRRKATCLAGSTPLQ